MPIVRVARHGETTWNVEGRYQGRLEAPLSALGALQADALAQTIRKTETGRVICSPLERTRATARPSAALLACQIEEDERLIEIRHGTWEGRLREELAQNDSQRYRAWREHPECVSFENGESILQVLERWERFARALQSDVECLIVTHDAVLRVAILAAIGAPLSDFWQPHVVNGGYAQFFATNGDWQLQFECIDTHLANLHSNLGRQAL